MAAARFDFEKFSGKNDFGLWKVKMKAMLIQQGLWEAMKYKAPDKDADTDDKEEIKKLDLMERAHSAIMLSLGDRVLRESSGIGDSLDWDTVYESSGIGELITYTRSKKRKEASTPSSSRKASRTTTTSRKRKGQLGKGRLATVVEERELVDEELEDEEVGDEEEGSTSLEDDDIDEDEDNYLVEDDYIGDGDD
ncbi:mitotic apparatus protein p62-like [Salvia splendens]|uniref:mitotic apparatus protein p62-like n=1 Tax=Salvia splendens TaxID=180675 RepID=UPI001C266D9D|nr:mitotic apparatus protein p62-like [Salvia splendens]